MCVPPDYLACWIICDRAKHQFAKANLDGINNSDGLADVRVAKRLQKRLERLFFVGRARPSDEGGEDGP